MLKLLFDSFLKCWYLEAKNTSMYIELLDKEIQFHNFHSIFTEYSEATKSLRWEKEEPECLCFLLRLKQLSLNIWNPAPLSKYCSEAKSSVKFTLALKGLSHLPLCSLRIPLNLYHSWFWVWSLDHATWVSSGNLLECKFLASSQTFWVRHSGGWTQRTICWQVL